MAAWVLRELPWTARGRPSHPFPTFPRTPTEPYPPPFTAGNCVHMFIPHLSAGPFLVICVTPVLGAVNSAVSVEVLEWSSQTHEEDQS